MQILQGPPLAAAEIELLQNTAYLPTAGGKIFELEIRRSKRKTTGSLVVETVFSA